jgi:hypothetical protein
MRWSALFGTRDVFFQGKKIFDRYPTVQITSQITIKLFKCTAGVFLTKLQLDMYSSSTYCTKQTDKKILGKFSTIHISAIL